MESKQSRIKAYWKAKGFRTGSAFAKVLGISASHFSEADGRGDNQKLKGAIYSKAEFRDLNWEWFLTGTGAMIQEPPPPVTPDDPHLRIILDKWSTLTLAQRDAALAAVLTPPSDPLKTPAPPKVVNG